MAAKTASVAPQKSPKASHSQDALSLQVSLPQMLDLALGTPEVGAVNLNILHNFLHVLLYQINLRSTKVEYRGDEAKRLKTIINSSKDGPTLQLHEYSITDGSGKVTQRSSDAAMNADVYTDPQSSGKPAKGGKPAASAPTTARGKPGRDGSESSMDNANGSPAAKKTKGSKHQIGAGSDGERQSVIFIEPVLDGVAPTALGFKRLDESVRSLEKKFQALDDLANNPEMIERVRGSKTDPLSDMWHVINISKRLDASEQGIDKLTTMVQDLIKSDKIEVTGGGNLSEELGHVNERIVELENQLSYLSGDIADLKNVGDVGATPENPSGSGRHTPSAREADPSKISVAIADENSPAVASASLSKNISSASAAKSPPVQVASTSEQPEEATGENEPPEESEKPAGSKKPSDQTTGSNSRQDVQKKPSSPGRRRSVIGGVDLTELQNNVATLRQDLTSVQKKVQDLGSKIVEDRGPAEVSKVLGFDEKPVETPGVANDAANESPRETGPAAAQSAAAVSGTEKKTTTAVASVTSKKTASKVSITTGSRVAAKFRPTSSAHVAPEEFDDEKMARCMEAVRNVEAMYAEALRDLDSRIADLEKEMGCVTDKINSESGLGLEGSGGVADLVAKIQTIQADMEKLNQTSSKLMDDQENRETHTTALIEQIELLKTIKADKEDLEDALADKADAQAVNRKVSHDQFDAACDDLARGLEEAITKLGQQESVWQQSLDDVQREIEGKLDKIEISPLKDFVNNRLKLLQEKLKAMSEMRRENEAAGTKKLLSDVKCISCDAKVVMRMEEGAHYQAPIMPCSKSIKPYLTYELDQVRKQQRRLPRGRNMIQFEAAMQEMARKSKSLKEDTLARSPRDHLCNRYCGGSHTITTPQQRVMRMGHFLTQWGPEAIQLTEGVVRGNDGQLYKSRGVLGKPDVCGPCGDGDSVEIPLSIPPTQSISEPAPVSHRQSQASQRRSSVVQTPRRQSSRRVSEPIKEASKISVEEIPVEPSTPPSATPGTIVDEGDASPEPVPSEQVVREGTPEGARTPDEFTGAEEMNDREE